MYSGVLFFQKAVHFCSFDLWVFLRIIFLCAHWNIRFSPKKIAIHTLLPHQAKNKTGLGPPNILPLVSHPGDDATSVSTGSHFQQHGWEMLDHITQMDPSGKNLQVVNFFLKATAWPPNFHTAVLQVAFRESNACYGYINVKVTQQNACSGGIVFMEIAPERYFAYSRHGPPNF